MSSDNPVAAAPIFVLLLSPYKVGSCFVGKILADNGVPHARLHAYDAVEQQKILPTAVTHFITVRRRRQLDLYISAYYADINQAPYYPYAYAATADEVVAAPIETLVEHFKKQPWHSFRWLNFQYYDAWMRWFQRRGVPVLCLETESLSETIAPAFQKLFAAAAPDKVWSIDTKPSHVTEETPNGSRYAELKKAIKAAATLS